MCIKQVIDPAKYEIKTGKRSSISFCDNKMEWADSAAGMEAPIRHIRNAFSRTESNAKPPELIWRDGTWLRIQVRQLGLN